MRGIPGMQVVLPGRRGRARARRCPRMLAQPAPCYVRYNARPPAVAHHDAVRARPRRGALARATTSRSSPTASCCARRSRRARVLEARGRRVRARQPAHARRRSTRRRSSTPRREPRLLVTVEDHFLTGGLYSHRRRAAPARAALARRVLPIALDERWFTPGAPRRRARATRASPASAIAARILDARSRSDADAEPRRAQRRPIPCIDALRRALRARRGPHPRRHADAGQGARAVRARRRAQVPRRAARARTSGTSTATSTSTSAWRSGRSSLGYAYPAVDDAIRAQLARRHHLLADAPARGRGRRAGARRRPRRRERSASPRPAAT